MPTHAGLFVAFLFLLEDASRFHFRLPVTPIAGFVVLFFPRERRRNFAGEGRRVLSAGPYKPTLSTLRLLRLLVFFV